MWITLYGNVALGPGFMRVKPSGPSAPPGFVSISKKSHELNRFPPKYKTNNQITSEIVRKYRSTEKLDVLSQFSKN